MYLGIMIDNKLKWNEHVEIIIKKLAREVGLLGRLGSELSNQVKELVCKTLVMP